MTSNPHELELIFSNTTPSLDDKIILVEKYKNLMEYLGLKHGRENPNEERAQSDSFKYFSSLNDLNALKRRIENYASIHHINLN